jgi:hypothetical protein
VRALVCDAKLVSAWVSKQMGVHEWSAPAAIGLAQDGELFAGVVYDYFNGASVCMHVAATRAHWLDREFLWFAFYYPFEQLGVKRVTGLIPEVNAQSRKFAEHLGFLLETRLADAHPQGDVLVYRMFRHECRWLRRGLRNEQAGFTVDTRLRRRGAGNSGEPAGQLSIPLGVH